MIFNRFTKKLLYPGLNLSFFTWIDIFLSFIKWNTDIFILKILTSKSNCLKLVNYCKICHRWRLQFILNLFSQRGNWVLNKSLSESNAGNIIIARILYDCNKFEMFTCIGGAVALVDLLYRLKCEARFIKPLFKITTKDTAAHY